MSAHTPGPWRYERDEDGSMAEHDDTFKPRYIRCDSKPGALMGGVKYYPWTPDNEADWVLIAAAPDLLAELKATRDAFYRCLTVNGTNAEFATVACGRADAAIAKAEGRS